MFQVSHILSQDLPPLAPTAVLSPLKHHKKHLNPHLLFHSAGMESTVSKSKKQNAYRRKALEGEKITLSPC